MTPLHIPTVEKMYTHRAMSMLLLTALLLAVAWRQAEAQTQFVLQPESRLWIDGTSNLHDWTCNVEALEGTLNATSASLLDVQRVEVNVPAESIDCDKGRMNKKMLEALRAEDHPTISYMLESAEGEQGADASTLLLRTRGRLTVAGVERAVEMDVNGEVLESGQVRLTGALTLLMTDFEMDPPRALLGTLKTGDEVEVHFDVVVQAVEGEATSVGDR